MKGVKRGKIYNEVQAREKNVAGAKRRKTCHRCQQVAKSGKTCNLREKTCHRSQERENIQPVPSLEKYAEPVPSAR